MTKNKSPRKIHAEKLYLELLELGHVSESQKEATCFLTNSSLKREEDTRPTPKQKPAYKGIEFRFDSPLDLAIYFITELPIEWEKWQEQTEIMQQIINEKAKKDAKPTIDRIDSSKHYERGNIRMKSQKENRELSNNDKKKPIALMVVEEGINGFQIFESNRALESFLGGVSYKKVKNMTKKPYGEFVVDKQGNATITNRTVLAMPVKVLESTNGEEEYKAQCEAYGITYETPEVRAEREQKQIARVEQQYKEMCEIDGKEYLPPEVRRKKAESKSYSEVKF